MSQKNLPHSGLVMPLCLLILIVCCACKPAGKETVEVGGLWPSYSLPAAVSAADSQAAAAAVSIEVMLDAVRELAALPD